VCTYDRSTTEGNDVLEGTCLIDSVVLINPLSFLGVVGLQRISAFELRMMPMEFDLLYQEPAQQLHQLRLLLQPLWLNDMSENMHATLRGGGRIVLDGLSKML
jgi:hypothetical protein